MSRRQTGALTLVWWCVAEAFQRVVVCRHLDVEEGDGLGRLSGVQVGVEELGGPDVVAHHHVHRAAGGAEARLWQAGRGAKEEGFVSAVSRRHGG